MRGTRKLASFSIDSVLKNANCLAEEVQLLNTVARLEAEIGNAPDREIERLSVVLQEARLRLALPLERQRASSRGPVRV